MGWTGIDSRHVKNPRDFLKEDMFRSGDRMEVVESSQHGQEVYFAVKIKDPDNYLNYYEPDVDGSITVGMVILFTNRRGEFMYKDMDETMGPVASNPGKKVLKRLSPLKPADGSDGPLKWATEWRKRGWSRYKH
jgi:hypothetical protein